MLKEVKADPFKQTDVIDERAPRFNQATIGILSLAAIAFNLPWLLGLLALQLFIGVTFGRKYCLPCVAYFKLVQPRFGEGELEDSRPPRFANKIGIIFLTTATALIYAGFPVGWWFGGLVAALALLAASTGLCVGCVMYKAYARLNGVRHKQLDKIDLDELDFNNRVATGENISAGPLKNKKNNESIIQFTHPLCSDCLKWDIKLSNETRPVASINVAKDKTLAHKYGISYVPTVIVVNDDGLVLEQLSL